MTDVPRPSKALLLALILGFTVAGPSWAKRGNEAKACLTAKVWDYYGQGWSMRSQTTATVEKADYVAVPASVFKGREYRVEACSGDGSSVVDLVVYDGLGQEVARSTGDQRDPSVTFRAPSSGAVLIAVHLREAQVDQADVAVAVFYKPGI